jgi:hypothetical protein
MGRFPKSAIALLAALGVLVVLITPAFDELPSTAPHTMHHTITLSVSIVPLLLHTAFHGPIHETETAKLLGGADLICLNCTRLC